MSPVSILVSFDFISNILSLTFIYLSFTFPYATVLLLSVMTVQYENVLSVYQWTAEKREFKKRSFGYLYLSPKVLTLFVCFQ